MYLWSKEKRTRYGCTPKAKQPPDLAQVITALRKESQRRLGLRRSRDLRGIVARGSRMYADRGPADDLVRFLFNVGILVEDPEEDAIYFNATRAESILECCELVREPPPSDPKVFLEACRAKRRHEAAAPQENQVAEESPEPDTPALDLDAADTLEFAEVSDEMLDAMTAPETVPIEEIVPLLVADPPTADFEPFPVPDQAPTMPPDESQPDPVRYVMYLTPIEMDIWETIVTLARPYNAVAWRVAAPTDPEQLFGRWKAGRFECEEEEYAFVFRRFVDNMVLSEVGDTYAAQKTYTLRFDPSACRAVPIEKRGERVVSEEELEFIRAFQRGEVRTDAAANTASTYGLLDIEEGRPHRIAVRGFEREEFVTHAMRERARPPRSHRPTQAPRSRPSSTAPPKDIRLETESRLAAQREELEKRIERAQAETAGWTEQIAAIDADLVRRRDSKRQDLLKKKAEIERQLAELESA